MYSFFANSSAVTLASSDVQVLDKRDNSQRVAVSGNVEPQKSMVLRARLSGSIHFIKELNNHSRYCFSCHAVQGRMAADWRMMRVFRGYRGKPFATHATPWCGAASTISALAEITGLQAGPGLGRSRGRAQPPGKPRTWRMARHSGSRRVTTPVWSGQGDFLLYGAIVRPFRRPDGQQLPQVGRSPYLDRAEHGTPACAESSPYTRYGLMMALGEVHAE